MFALPGRATAVATAWRRFAERASTARGLRPELLPDGGIGGSGQKRDDADAPRTKLLTQGFRECQQAALGGVVGGHSGKRYPGGDAEIVDDHTSLPEEREQGLGDQECAVQIGVDHLAPSVVIKRSDGLRGTGDAGVVDEHVEAFAPADEVRASWATD